VEQLFPVRIVDDAEDYLSPDLQTDRYGIDRAVVDKVGSPIQGINDAVIPIASETDSQGRAVPFFAHGWEERFLESNPMDRAIFAIEHLLEIGHQALAQLPDHQKAQVLTVPFEPFVLDPWPWLRQMETFLGTHVTPATRRELKRQKVPRARIAAGVARKIYKQYGWTPPAQGGDERGELASRRAFVAKEASAEGLRVMDRLCETYAATHLHGAIPW